VGEGEGGKIWENGIETCKISCMKRDASPGSMRKKKKKKKQFTRGRRSSVPEEREEDELMKMTGVTIRSKSSHQFPIIPPPRNNDFCTSLWGSSQKSPLSPLCVYIYKHLLDI